MSVLRSGILERLDKAPTASQPAFSLAARSARNDLPGGESVSESKEEPLLMALITPCQPPKHSKWHLASGAVVLLVVYVTVLAGVRWLLQA
jgi:hypothetical protein